MPGARKQQLVDQKDSVARQSTSRAHGHQWKDLARQSTSRAYGHQRRDLARQSTSRAHGCQQMDLARQSISRANGKDAMHRPDGRTMVPQDWQVDRPAWTAQSPVQRTVQNDLGSRCY
jgi:hypothetical protein